MAPLLGDPTPAHDPTSPRRTPAHVAAFALPVLLLALATALYIPLLRLPFVADDYPNLLHPWNFVAAASPEFRPLHSALLAAARAAFGLHPVPWHLLSLALHLGTVAAAYALALRLSTDRPRLRQQAVAAVAALVFLLDPRAIQAVVWPSAVGDLGYALAFLLAVLAWPLSQPTVRSHPRLGFRPYLCACLYLLALGCKEAAIVLPAVLLLIDLHLRPAGPSLADRLRTLAPCLAAGAAFGAFEAVRPHLLLLLGDRAQFVYAVTGGYHLVGGRLLARNLLAYPDLTLFPWVPQTWALHPGPLRLMAVPAAALLMRWLYVGGLRRVGAVWILATIAPALLFAPYDVSDLYLYLPVFGLALAAAEEAAPRRAALPTRALGAAALAALLLAEGIGFAGLSAAWRREGAAFARARTVLLVTAGAYPTATLVVRGLPSFDGEVYLWMDALPYAMQLLAPTFRGRVTYRAAGAGPHPLLLSFGPDGRLRALGPSG